MNSDVLIIIVPLTNSISLQYLDTTYLFIHLSCLSDYLKWPYRYKANEERKTAIVDEQPDMQLKLQSDKFFDGRVSDARTVTCKSNRQHPLQTSVGIYQQHQLYSYVQIDFHHQL